ncbi:MAG: T9SS type A sorting domain-containing protein [Bacteroidetes bacterium]|nr:T9SS type A sorting domain-containing protein [Bacteroidota bacterium]
MIHHSFMQFLSCRLLDKACRSSFVKALGLFVAIVLSVTTTPAFAQLRIAEDSAVIINTPGKLLYAHYSPDGSHIVTGGGDSAVRVWDLSTKTQVAAYSVGNGGKAPFAQFTPDGDHLLISKVAPGNTNDSVLKWNWREGRQVWIAEARYGIMSGDGHTLVLLGVDNVISVANPESGLLLRTLGTFKPGFVTSRMRLTRTGDRLLVGEPSKPYVLIDTKTSAILDTFAMAPDGGSARSARFSSDDKRILFAFASPTLLDGSTHDTIVKISDQLQTDDADISPDGRYIATLSGLKQVRVWNAANGSLIRELGANEQQGYSLVFSPDGTHIMSSSLDQTVRIWTVPTVSAVEASPTTTACAAALTAYPDPARDQIVAHYTMSAAGAVRLALVNSLGEEILSVEHAAEEAGEHQAVLDTRALPSGVYLLRVRAGSRQVTHTVRVEH